MAMRLEIHPGEGGEDAAMFASELACAVSRHANAAITNEGRVAVLVVPDHL